MPEQKLPQFKVVPEEKGGLTDEQARAVSTRGGQLLLSASAGAGKTTVLTRRVVERLAAGASVSELLIVTFTRAAAAEMRARIARELRGALKQEADPAQKEHLARQLVLLPQARISTMDSFCTNLLRRNFQKLGLAPDFRILQGGEWELCREAAATEAMEALYEAGDEDFLACVDCFSGDRDDENFLSQLLRFFGKLENDPTPLESLAAWSALYDEAKTPQDSLWGRENARLTAERLSGLRGAFAFMRQCAEQSEELSEKIVEQRCFEAEALDEAVAAGRRGEPILPFLDARKQSPTGKKAAELREVWQPINRVISARDVAKTILNESALPSEEEFAKQRELSLSLLRGLTAAAERYFACLQKQYARKNALPFQEINRKALALLEESYDPETGLSTPSEYARELCSGKTGEGISEVLIDEFQDTNLLQNRIFLALSGGGQGLFCVGDLKQSIYRFRGARPDLFARCLASFSPEEGRFPQVQYLTRNFRSSQGVLGFVNALFSQIMHRSCGGADYDANQYAYAGLAYPPGDYDTEFLLYDPDETKEEEAAYREGRVCAERICELLESGRTVWDPRRKASRPMRLSDVAILSRRVSGGRGEALLRALEDAGLPAYCNRADDLFDHYEVRFVLAFLRAVDNPFYDISLAAALRSPIFGFSAQELCDLRENGGGTLFDCLNRSEEPHAADAAAFLARYRTRARHWPVYRLLGELYSETALFEVVGGMSQGAARRENLRLIYQNACAYEENSLRGLYGFLQYMERLSKRERSQEAATAAPKGDFVTIQTIHAAKGLEYPFVFLTDLGSAQSNAGSASILLSPDYGVGFSVRDLKRRISYKNFPYRLIRQSESQSELEETMRLLYVAATRAREKLFLVAKHLEALDPEESNIGREEPKRWLREAVDCSPVRPGQVLLCSSMRDLLFLGLLRHPDGRAYFRSRGYDPQGEDSAREQALLTDCVRRYLGGPTDGYRLTIRFSDRTLPRGEQRKAAAPAPAAAKRASLALWDYEYPFAGLAGVPAKVSVSDLKGLREMDEDAELVLTRRVSLDPPEFLGKKLTAAERGTATHKLMQFLRFGGESAAEQAAALQRAGTLTPEEAAALPLFGVDRFLQSALAARIRRSTRVEREYRFLSRVPASRFNPALTGEEKLLLQGVIDLFYEENDGWVIVDYKTDSAADEAYYRANYETQLRLYAQALEDLTGHPVLRREIWSFAAGKEIVL